MLPVAAKQEAFEESIKLKNQFRNLDEDEIEFLDSVLESTRAKEEAVRKETTEQLDLFRRQQEEVDKTILEEGGATEEGTGGGKAGNPTAEETTWAVNAKKRKRAKEKEGLKGVKLRKSSSTVETTKERETTGLEVGNEKLIASVGNKSIRKTAAVQRVASPSTASDKAPTPISKQANGGIVGTAGLGLGGYSSDEDD